MKKKIIYGLLAILGLLMLTNPSNSSLKDHLGLPSDRGIIKESNYFVFSRYSVSGVKYIGIMGNFWRGNNINKEAINIEKIDTSERVDIKELPYKERVYFALKDNIKDFNTPLSEFENKIKDKDYDLKVYKALKDNLQGFDKTEDEFISLIND